jgi:tRNA(fMet)-specific endonuclease VapC
MLLDTSFLVDLLREGNKNEPGPATRRLEALEDAEFLIPVFVLCELRTGAELSRSPRRELAQVNRLVEAHPVVYPDSSFPALFGEAAALLIRNGTPVPVMDLMIGVVAKRFGAAVLTRDVEHFQKIPGVTVLDY